LKREILVTGDGSTTIHLPEWDEPYHSKHGAINEAIHVFIEMGLRYVSKTVNPKSISILEIGFGTGLNALLTKQISSANQWNINYTGVEAFPVSEEEASHLNYAERLALSNDEFLGLHRTPWETNCAITETFQLTKRKQFFDQINDQDCYDLIYFDAFGARVQPELWTESIFELMFNALKQGGILVTYAAKGSVRRAMQTVGFNVERLPGPPGKREMLRAQKPIH
jgi:tRNA U34 5-methylaminomethyl-2-thiouridine-forming methyltransferase MnmC